MITVLLLDDFDRECLTRGLRCSVEHGGMICACCM